MVTKKAKVENIGVCGKCEKEKDLPHDTKSNGKVCDDCFIELNEAGLTFDEYDLRPDERTKEQAADYLQCTTRNIEILKSSGKLAAQKRRRRVNGIVRKQLIFKTSDLEKFKNAADQPTEVPTVVKENEMQKTNIEENNEILSSSQLFVAEKLGQFAEAMNHFSRQLPGMAAAPTDNQPKFLTVEEASKEYRLAQAEIHRLIEDGSLRKLKGSKGEILISRKQIEEL